MESSKNLYKTYKASILLPSNFILLCQIPACLQEFDGIMYSATCWLDEAQSWLSAPCSFTAARSLQNYANSLQVSDVVITLAIHDKM